MLNLTQSKQQLSDEELLLLEEWVVVDETVGLVQSIHVGSCSTVVVWAWVDVLPCICTLVDDICTFVDDISNFFGCLLDPRSEAQLLELLLLFDLCQQFESLVRSHESLVNGVHDLLSILIVWRLVNVLPSIFGVGNDLSNLVNNLLSNVSNLSAKVFNIVKETQLLELLLLVEWEIWDVHATCGSCGSTLVEKWGIVSSLCGVSSLANLSPRVFALVKTFHDWWCVFVVWLFVNSLPEGISHWCIFVDLTAHLFSNLLDFFCEITGILEEITETEEVHHLAINHYWSNKLSLHFRGF
jgi:hypothetical protein